MSESMYSAAPGTPTALPIDPKSLYSQFSLPFMCISASNVASVSS
jgi:hypothetical protein